MLRGYGWALLGLLGLVAQLLGAQSGVVAVAHGLGHIFPIARLNRLAARRASEDARGARIAARYEARVAAGREDAEDLFEMTAPDC